MNDPDFGEIVHSIDAWRGEVPFRCAASGTERLRVDVRSGTAGPSDAQRKLFRALKQRYESLWPHVAVKILELRRDIGDAARLPTLLRPTVGVSIPGVIGSQHVDFMLVYEFKDDETRRGYFISFVSWAIARADVAS